MIRVSPSVLAADFAALGNELQDIARAGADFVHLDVMDGVFVPNISFGIPVIRGIRKAVSLPFDVHLMIVEPERYADQFAQAGADYITFHLEATSDPAGLLSHIRALGKYASVSIKPDTPVETLFPLLPLCDMVLIMTVEPGFGGQALIPHTIDKVRKISQEIKRQKCKTLVEVDGGVYAGNAAELISAGADVLVAGSAVFKADDRRAAIEALRSSIQKS